MIAPICLDPLAIAYALMALSVLSAALAVWSTIVDDDPTHDGEE